MIALFCSVSNPEKGLEGRRSSKEGRRRESVDNSKEKPVRVLAVDPARSKNRPEECVGDRAGGVAESPREPCDAPPPSPCHPRPLVEGLGRDERNSRFEVEIHRRFGGVESPVPFGGRPRPPTDAGGSVMETFMHGAPFRAAQFRSRLERKDL